MKVIVAAAILAVAIVAAPIGALFVAPSRFVVIRNVVWRFDRITGAVLFCALDGGTLKFTCVGPRTMRSVLP